MATGNFFYQNRCVVITENDYEVGNVPEKGEALDNDSYYPSATLKAPCFDYWTAVITDGYPSGSCIDYIRREDGINMVVGYIGYPSSQSELIDACRQAFGLSVNKIKEIIGNVNGADIDQYIEEAEGRIADYLAEQEEKEVNEFIDHIKETYGYRELQ